MTPAEFGIKQSPIFTFRIIRSIAELGWQAGQDMTFTPEGTYSNFQIISHMPIREDGYYAERVIHHWTRFRQTGQCPAVSELSALDYLKMRVRQRQTA